VLFTNIDRISAGAYFDTSNSAPSSNGKIPDSDSVYRGSSPRGASIFVMTKPLYWIKRVALLSLGMITLYFGAALIGSYWPANPDWRETPDGITIYVETNGHHTGIVVPVAAAGIDLSLTFRPTDLSDKRLAGNWLAIGWGDRNFYLNTRTWSDLRPSTALSALIGSGRTLLHIDHLDRPYPGDDQRAVRISHAEYQGLIAAVMASLKRGEDGHPVAIPGYSDRDLFYEAKGHYSLLRTCNGWTAETLRAAGIKAPLWTPFSGGVMRWY
jgi:uncharacterized protein (TIGR02117 family)